MSTKLPAAVDEASQPPALLLALMQAVGPVRYVLADKGYDTNAIVAVGQAGAEVMIPSKKNRTYCRLIDRVRYRLRNWVARFLNCFERLSPLSQPTRYEKTATSFLGCC